MCAIRKVKKVSCSLTSAAKARIINIGSVGGKMGPPFLGAYSAAKHGAEGFSESLRRELQLVGIDVIVIQPRSVATPT